VSARVSEGDVFGRLKVIDVFERGELLGIDSHDWGIWCRVRCTCGVRFRLRASELRRKRRASCGCWARENYLRAHEAQAQQRRSA
jgi:hypothetical protein